MLFLFAYNPRVTINILLCIGSPWGFKAPCPGTIDHSYYHNTSAMNIITNHNTDVATVDSKQKMIVLKTIANSY